MVDLIEDNWYDSSNPVPRFIGDILIFDANNLAHRCRHTFNLSNDGLDISVTYGFLKTLAATIRKYDTKMVIVCWDYGIPSYRKEKMPEYKANRSHSDDDSWEDFIRQINQLHDILPKFGVASVKKKQAEADDLIYHVTRLLKGDYRRIVVSTDQDLLQCVQYDTIVLSPTKDLEITNVNFEDTVGVTQKEFLVYKSLIGDSSDNIPGCRGIGDITAKKLLAAYGASPSGMLNAANGNNPDKKYMTSSIASNLKIFESEGGFKRIMPVIRLDHDKIGCKLSLLYAFEKWKSYQHKVVKRFLSENAFVSLLDPSFYNLFRPLESPSKLIPDDIGKLVRFPAVAPFREPISEV